MDGSFSWLTVIGLILTVVVLSLQWATDNKKAKKEAKEKTEKAKEDLKTEVKTGTWASITTAISNLAKKKKEEKEI